jgi:hypothetical protein
LKILSHLGLSFVKNLPWFVIETNGSKLSFFIFLSQYSIQKYLVCIKMKKYLKRHDDLLFF